MDGTNARIIAASPMIGRTSGPVRGLSNQIPRWGEGASRAVPIPVMADLDVGSCCSLARRGWGR